MKHLYSQQQITDAYLAPALRAFPKPRQGGASDMRLPLSAIGLINNLNKIFAHKNRKEGVTMGRFLCLMKAMALVLFLAMPSAGWTEKKTSIQVKGSDTEVNLVQRLAEVFMKRNPDVSIAVTGGGSGTGIAALINKQTDITNSSRAMKEEEIEQAKANGVEPVAIIFAVDGLALIAHETLPINALTIDELGKIFRGEIVNWKEVGGPDMEISLYGRTSASGTYVFFRDNVLKGDYSPKMNAMVGTSHIVEAVKKDKSGIGYVGVGYVKDEQGKVIHGIKVLKLAKDKNSPAVSPLEIENVKSGLYPLSRPLYQYTNGKPKGKLLEFIRFELSEEGQELILKEGFFPVTREYMERNRELGIIK